MPVERKRTKTCGVLAPGKSREQLQKKVEPSPAYSQGRRRESLQIVDGLNEEVEGDT